MSESRKTTESNETTAQRLARLHRACVNGMQAAAELELHGWRREAGCPVGAVTLLSALLARRGELREAWDVLCVGGRLDADRLDAEGLRLAISLCTQFEDDGEAARLTRALHDRFGQDAATARWLAASDAPGVSALPTLAFARVDQLAEELKGRIDLVPSLVFAQKARPRTSALVLLRAALTRLVPGVSGDDEKSLTLCKALAELSMLAGDDSEARRWSHRGLKLDPYSAELALVLSWVEDDATVGEPVKDVLHRVAQKHPGYRDVAAALGRREATDTAAWDERRAA